MSKPTIAIVGASADRAKFGNKAVRAYARQGYEVYPIHPTADSIEGHKAYRHVAETPAAALDRISVYLPPAASIKVLPDLAAKPAREVWFNPGADDDASVIAQAKALGLNVILGCSIVDVGVNPADLG
jgi:predicted CoA-binding protein